MTLTTEAGGRDIDQQARAGEFTSPATSPRPGGRNAPQGTARRAMRNDVHVFASRRGLSATPAQFLEDVEVLTRDASELPGAVAIVTPRVSACISLASFHSPNAGLYSRSHGIWSTNEPYICPCQRVTSRRS
ncbi:hypothetical protein M8818_005330 [Zalaria obscura]|uniref:Uncharacterized protein n=1 Tax=Zalaria obscura TaxID=2024903 RepID=A0ACC3S9N3_9PEZI